MVTSDNCLFCFCQICISEVNLVGHYSILGRYQNRVFIPPYVSVSKPKYTISVPHYCANRLVVYFNRTTFCHRTMQRLLILSMLGAIYSVHSGFIEQRSSGDFPLPKEGGKLDIIGHKAWHNFGYKPCFLEAGKSHVYQTQTFEFNLRTHRWTSHTLDPHPPQRAFTATFPVSNRTLWVFGGIDLPCTVFPFTVYSDIWKFSTEHLEWTQVATSGGPGPRFGHAHAVVGHKLFVFAGLSPSFSGFNDLWFYNTLTGTWTLENAGSTNTTTHPAPRFNLFFVYNKEHEVLIAAFGDIPPAGSVTEQKATNFARKARKQGDVLSDVWFYHLNNHTWSKRLDQSDSIGDRTQGCAWEDGDVFVVAFGDVDSSPRCDNNVTGYGDNPSPDIFKLQITGSGGFTNITKQIGDFHAIKSPACGFKKDTRKVWVFGGQVHLC